MEAAEHLFSLSESADRPDDMIRAVRPLLISVNGSMSCAHRLLVHTAYKTKVLSLLKGYHRIEKGESRNRREAGLKEEYLGYLRGLIRSTALEVVDLIQYKLLVFENNIEGVIFYQKILGDYYRYMAESGDSDASALSSQNYLKALDRAPQLPVFHPTRLSLILNYSVFHHDIKKDVREATIIAKEGFDLAIKEVHSLEPELYKEVMELLDLIRDNIKAWKEERRAKANKGGAEMRLKPEVVVR